MSAMEDFKEAFRVTKEQLEDKLYARMEQENEAYLAEIKTKPVDEIIANAYKIAWRENLLYLLIAPTASFAGDAEPLCGNVCRLVKAGP